MKAETVKEVVQKLIGPINPVAETNQDNINYENLKNMCDLVEGLIEQINDVSIRNRKDYQFSVKRAGNHAFDFINRIKSEY